MYVVLYVLIRTDHRTGPRFVARSGCDHSYTDQLRDAQTFAIREEAERERCGNEMICTVEEVLR